MILYHKYLQCHAKNDIIFLGDIMDNEIELRIIAIIDKIRPFLISDVGNLEFVKYEDNIVYVRLSGACKDCAMIDITLKDGIEEMIVNEIPEVKEVKNVD